MIEALCIIVIAVGFATFAEWKHYKSGNGKRFEQIHRLIDSDSQF